MLQINHFQPHHDNSTVNNGDAVIDVHGTTYVIREFVH